MENSAGLSFPYVYQSQQGIALPNGMFSNGETQFSVNPLNVVLKQNQCRQLPALNELGDAARQVIEKANAVYTFLFFFLKKKLNILPRLAQSHCWFSTFRFPHSGKMISRVLCRWDLDRISSSSKTFMVSKISRKIWNVLQIQGINY